MSSFTGKVAAITGGGSGIGQALAVGLAERGARIAICDVNEAGLAATGDLVKAAGGEIHTAVVDVSDQASVAGWATSVAEHYGVVHQIYNNAGIGMTALPVETTTYESFKRVLDINVWGVIHGVKEFLPHLIASGDGQIVNVSSLNGIMGQPGLGAYCTSKFAVRGLSETLRAEMLVAGHPVQVTVVHPGGVKTNISAGAYKQPDLDADALKAQERRREVYGDTLFTTTSRDAAETILKGVEKKKGRVRIGQATTIDRLVRLFPESYPRLVARWEKKTFASEAAKP